MIRKIVFLYLFWAELCGILITPALGTCDTSSCPIVCKGYPCPSAALPRVPIDPTSTSSATGCLEVVIETPGYPTSYPGETCVWGFTTNLVHASVAITLLELDGSVGDRLLISRTRSRANRGDQTSNLFNNDATAANMPENPTLTNRADLLTVMFTPLQHRYHHRGIKLRIMFAEEDATEACRGQSPGTTLTLDGGLPTAAINSPNFPGRYPDNRLCYYKVTSPAASRIILEFLERLDLIDLEDFIYIYDISNPSEVSLLRIISAGPFSEYSFIETESNMIQIVFESRPGSGARGFFIRASYQEIESSCNGNGDSTDGCTCTSIGQQPVCRIDESGGTDFQQLTADDVDDLTHRCSASTDVTLDFSNFNAILAPDSYFTPSGASEMCEWVVSGPTGSQFALIIKDFLLAAADGAGDVFEIRYADGRDSVGFLRYSTSVVNIPLTVDPTVYSIMGTPIVIDTNQFTVAYSASNVMAANKGPLFEVHILDAASCSAPCLNGGRCSASCTCDPGFVGEFCEQSSPSDFTCLVKNHYERPQFAYPVELLAIAGTNTFNAADFSFNKYSTDKSGVSLVALPSQSVEEPQYYGRSLSLPSNCDQKGGSSRLGVFSCVFAGDEFVDQVEIPAIVNPISEFLSPVGRFTRTVSVEDPEVTFSVTHTISEQSLRWRFNGQTKKRWNGKSSITIKNIQREDGGIYECFIRGQNGKEYDIVTYRLIVRACQDGKYNPPTCNMNCQSCDNGGTCTDNGECLCPPAYGGTDCSTVLTRDTISRNGLLTCTGLGISNNGCKYVLLCLPDPGGCMCMPGWTGTKCDQACPPSKFGLDCLCELATGDCP